MSDNEKDSANNTRPRNTESSLPEGEKASSSASEPAHKKFKDLDDLTKKRIIWAFAAPLVLAFFMIVIPGWKLFVPLALEYMWWIESIFPNIDTRWEGRGIDYELQHQISYLVCFVVCNIYFSVVGVQVGVIEKQEMWRDKPMLHYVGCSLLFLIFVFFIWRDFLYDQEVSQRDSFYYHFSFLGLYFQTLLLTSFTPLVIFTVSELYFKFLSKKEAD